MLRIAALSILLLLCLPAFVAAKIYIIENRASTTGGGSANLTGTGTANYLTKWDNATDLGNSVLFQNGSAIGVNKADVDAIFDVESPLPAYGGTYWSNSAGIAMISTASINNYDRATYAFHTDSAGIGDYVRLDLGAGNKQAFNVVYISLSGDVGAVWSVQYSDDASSWTTVATADVKNGVSGAGTLETTWTTPAATHRYWQLNNTVGGAGGSYHTEVQFSTNGGLDIAAFRTEANTGFLFDASGDIQFKDVGTTRYTLGNDETDDNILKIGTTTTGTDTFLACYGPTQHCFIGDTFNTGLSFNSQLTLGNPDYTDFGAKLNAPLAILSGSATGTYPTIAFGWDTSTAYDSYYDAGITSYVVNANNAMRHELLFWVQRNNSFHAVPEAGLRLNEEGVGIGWTGRWGVDATEELEVVGTALFRPASAAATPVKVRGAAAQSANLQEWQNSTGGVLAAVGPSLSTGGNAGTALCVDANNRVCLCGSCA